MYMYFQSFGVTSGRSTDSVAGISCHITIITQASKNTSESFGFSRCNYTANAAGLSLNRF